MARMFGPRDRDRSGARRRASGRRGFRPGSDSLEARALLTTLPPGFVETQVATGLDEATSMAIAPDGRIFVTEQNGQLRVIENGQLLPTPALSLDVQDLRERGLVGVTLDPQFESNGYIYVYYTVPGSGATPAHNRVSRFTLNGDVADPASEKDLIDLDPLSSNPTHNGGAIRFGLGGRLYIAVGDNTDGNNAQSLDTTQGKMLRINADGSIPDDNPFVNVTTGVHRAIWALGLRNPFTFDVQPTTGRIFINDVGENTWEEIDDGKPGANYGWPVTEGPTSDPRFQGPLYAYDHGPNESNGSAITGGAFYDPQSAAFPSGMVGDYFFADFTGGWIRRLDPATGQVSDFATGVHKFIVDLDVDQAGGLYYLSRGATPGTSAVYVIRNPVSQPPTLSAPATQTVSLGGTATFSADVAGSAPLAFQWLKNGAPIPGANGLTYTIPSVGAGDLGAAYTLMATNPFGTAISAPATLNGNSPYVRALYIDILHQTPNPAGVTAGTIALASGVSPTALAAYFQLLPQARNQTAALTYFHVLGRGPTPQELTQAAGALYVTQTPDDLAASLYASREYYLQHGGNGRGFVVSLYRDLLGRDPSRSELAVAQRASSANARLDLARQLLASDTAHAREIAGWYLAYLRRLPAPAELIAWGGAMRAGWLPLQVQAGILGGPEYVADAPIIVAVATGLGRSTA